MAPRDLIGRAVLHAPTWMRSIRNVPILGWLVHRLSHRILPSEQQVWAQIEAGPGKGLRLQVNPRVADLLIQSQAEAEMQKIIAAHLRPGMVFFDLGANIGLFTLHCGANHRRERKGVQLRAESQQCRAAAGKCGAKQL